MGPLREPSPSGLVRPDESALHFVGRTGLGRAAKARALESSVRAGLHVLTHLRNAVFAIRKEAYFERIRRGPAEGDGEGERRGRWQASREVARARIYL